jgi:outer membrane immunogenic protein
MKTLSVAVAIVLTGPALAADLSVPYKAPLLSPRPVVSWSGIYVGGSIGADWRLLDAEVTAVSIGNPATAVTDITGPNKFNSLSVRLGGYVGANLQIDRFVVGVEADAGWTPQRAEVRDGSFYPSGITILGTPLGGQQDSFGIRLPWEASVRLRAGFLVSPLVMVYATSGAAWLRVEATSECSTDAASGVANCAAHQYFGGTLSPGTITNSVTRTGWTAGIGVEGIGGVDLPLLWRFEYRYSDYGKASFTDTRTCGGCTNQYTPLTVSYSTGNITTHSISVGLAYKFGVPGVPPAMR